MEPSSYGEPLTPEAITAAGYPTAPPAKSAPKLSKEQAKALWQRMKVAERHYECAFKEQFSDCIDLIRGEHYKTAAASNEDRVVVNVMPHIVETLTHSVTFEHPELIVKPLDRKGQMNQDTAEKVATYDYRKSNAHREARRAFKDSRIFNFGVIHVTWKFETDDGEVGYDSRPPVEGEAPDPEEVLKAVEEGRELPPPVPAAQIRCDEVCVKRIDPRMFRVSPESTWVLDQMPWCGYVEVKEVAEVKGDKRLSNTKQIKGSTKHLREYFDLDEQRSWRTPDGKEDAPDDIKRVCLWHYFEKKRRLHVIFCDEHDKPLLVEKWPWNHDRYPFRLVFTEPGEDQFYQKCPLLQVKHLQQEINHFHTQLSIHVRRFIRRYIARKGAFDEKAKKQARSGVDGTILETNEQNPDKALVAVMDAPLSPDIYNYEAKVMQYLSLLSGIDQYEMSRAPTKRMTQDEVAAVKQSGGARGKRAAASFETLCAEIAEDIVAWNQQYAMRARSLPVVANGEVVDWIDWTKDEIQGEFSFQTYVGSTELKNKAGQSEELGFLLQALQPYAAAPDPLTGQPMLNIRPLIHQLLALIPEIKDVNAIVSEEAPMPPMGMDPMMGGMDPLAQLAMGGAVPQEQMALPPAEGF